MQLLRQARTAVEELVMPLKVVADRFVESLENGTFDYEQPKTELRKFGKEFVDQIARRDLSQLRPLIQKAARWASRPAVLRRLKAALLEASAHEHPLTAAASVLDDSGGGDAPLEFDPMIQVASRWLEELDRRVPNATLAIALQMTKTNLSLPVDFLRWVHLRNVAKRSEGEKRGWALRELARHVTEHIHQRHVQIVYFGERLVALRDDDIHESYGSLLGFLKRTGTPLALQLVSVDASFVRNAASHADRWEFDEQARTILIRDRAGRSLQERRLTFDEAFDECERLAEETIALLIAVVIRSGNEFGKLIATSAWLDIFLADLAGNPFPENVVQREREALWERFSEVRKRLELIRPRRALPK